jgi:transposase
VSPGRLARFVARGLDGLTDEPRPGRPPTVSAEQIEEVMVATVDYTGGSGGEARWTADAEPVTAVAAFDTTVSATALARHVLAEAGVAAAPPERPGPALRLVQGGTS